MPHDIVVSTFIADSVDQLTSVLQTQQFSLPVRLDSRGHSCVAAIMIPLLSLCCSILQRDSKAYPNSLTQQSPNPRAMSLHWSMDHLVQGCIERIGDFYYFSLICYLSLNDV